jgi:hypothetical protein
MSFDRMLLWLSVKGEGSWSQFRGAVETFDLEPDVEEPAAGDTGSDLPIYQEARFTLQRLAHAEFSTGEGESDWRIVPPTVAILRAASAEGVLCGARTPGLLERLADARDLEVARAPATRMPEQIRVRGTSLAQLAARVRELGFLVQRDAPASLLSALPSVRDRSGWYSSAMPETPGWTVHRFAVHPEMKWVEEQQADARRASFGFFRFVMKHQRFYYLRSRGLAFRVPVQVGKYAVLRRRRGTVRYDADRRVLSFPVALRPPLLMERALVLCSGLLPRFDGATGRLEYSEVDDNVALLAGQLLHQEVR